MVVLGVNDIKIITFTLVCRTILLFDIMKKKRRFKKI